MSKMKICIIDYGVGNIRSIVNAFNVFDNIILKISHERSEILSSQGLILPGVGAFASCMENLKNKILHKAVLDLNKPILGICVGMQLMAEFSEKWET